MEKIVIVKLSSLGDIIHTLPAFNILRKEYPKSEIIWIVEKSGKKILELVNGIDKIYTIDTKALRKGRNIQNNIRKIRAIKKIKADAVFDFQGTLKSAVITALLISEKKIGFDKKNLKEKGAAFFYNIKANPFDELNHIIKKNISLLNTIGIKNQKIEFPDFRVDDKTVMQVKEKTDKIDLNQSVILNIGAGWQTKKLDIEKWITISKKLVKHEITPIILWGNSTEKETAKIITNEAKLRLFPLFTIEELIVLFKKIKLVVSADSFPLHLAEALNTPTVAIFGPTPPSRNGPFNPHSKIIYHKLKCSNCFKKKCGKLLCMKKITAKEVVDKIIPFF